MTANNVLENLENLAGTKFDENEIICAFEDFQEEGETNIIVDKSQNTGYDAIAYIDSLSSTQFLFKLAGGNIEKVWVA